MLYRPHFRVLTAGLFLVFAGTVCVAADADAGRTALDDYVAKPDATYSWEVAKTVPTGEATTYVVDLKSQTWRARPVVNRPVWQHWLVIVKPHKVTSNKALLFIGGGRNGRGAPNGPSQETQRIAALSRSVVAELRMIPNQPLEFHNDGVQRSEDDLVAYTWDQYLKTGDATWLARMPMVKSAVRAMDCVQELLAGPQGGEVEIDEFVVAGGSKRGWTTWLTGAVDSRVVAVMPIVIDVLNADVSMRHHFAAYGFWAPSVGDYVRHGIMDRMDTPEIKALHNLVDPFSYRARLTMPKFIVNASGDQFFLPDSSQFYFDELQGEKHLRYVPNADHSLKGTDALESIVAFHQTVLTGTRRPKYSWSMENDSSIRVTTDDRPRQVNLWQATNPNARDFRVESVGRIYTSSELTPVDEGVYVANVEAPEKGWTAFFVELVYETGTPLELKFTSGVRVVPDTLPYADKLPRAASE